MKGRPKTLSDEERKQNEKNRQAKKRLNQILLLPDADFKKALTEFAAGSSVNEVAIKAINAYPPFKEFKKMRFKPS